MVKGDVVRPMPVAKMSIKRCIADGAIGAVARHEKGDPVSSPLAGEEIVNFRQELPPRS